MFLTRLRKNVKNVINRFSKILSMGIKETEVNLVVSCYVCVVMGLNMLTGASYFE